MSGDVCFLTVTHKADLKMFKLLRNSLKMFAPDVPHVVIVDDEELLFYRHLFGDESQLSFLSSQFVLPARWEATRKRARRQRGSVMERVANKLGFQSSPLSGWCLQQLLKIHYLASTDFRVVVFLDSDLMLTRPFEAASLFEDGKLILPEGDARSVEDIGFEVSTRVMFGEDRGGGMQGHAYINQPPRFYGRTGRALVEALKRANAPVEWEYRFLRQQWPSEYHLLGFAARHIEGGDGYCFKHYDAASDTYEVRFAKDVQAMEQVFNLCLHERGRRGFMLVQSNLRVHTDALMERLGKLQLELGRLHAE